MKIAMCLEPVVGPKWHYALQTGVTEAVAISDPGIALWEKDTLADYIKMYTDFGFSVSTFEGWLDLNDIKTGGPLADIQTERLIQTIRNFGALGVTTYCYNWMANINWMRTQKDAVTRGGALTTIYDHRVSERSPEAKLPPRLKPLTFGERWNAFWRPFCRSARRQVYAWPCTPMIHLWNGFLGLSGS